MAINALCASDLGQMTRNGAQCFGIDFGLVKGVASRASKKLLEDVQRVASRASEKLLEDVKSVASRAS